ncbi:peroxiredoxin-like family protein [Dokdonia donghaensis]|uniref:Alkyl hydroperoxide reductase n=1 Tax=Dokdonia donghaensis DSW-1 TaxID=1300343 RepID=A0A0A2GTI4_9FLAO|nr:peroxiredoxin-like family protein [Dokdonia donghaensis]ANH59170.1 AhpC/TSA family protein [Dokdonia donghaensis DSW-1]KGO06589.1 alkyl hydroperoxide reductase [Dokdonia donghaensis DSW-1]
MLLPKTEVPALELPLINDTNWKLSDQNAENFTLLVFYRGLHCPVCKKQLEELSQKLDKFVDRGINVVAISADTEKRAKIAGEDWDIEGLPVAYNLSLEKAREYGLFISEAVSDKEPDFFTEPGLFLIKPDGTLFFSSVQSMPFARPHFDDILGGIDFIMKKDYPARGEVKGIPQNA